MEPSLYPVPDFINESAADYHAKRPLYLTSHQLIDFRRCPLAYKQQLSGLMPRKTNSEALHIGRAAHCLTLEGQAAFDAEFIVGGPINPKTGKTYGTETQAYEKWAEEQLPRSPLDDSQYALCCNLAFSVRSHPVAKRMLSKGVAEGVLRTAIYGVECQIRLDWFSPHFGIVDLKTCEDLDKFVSDITTYSYVPQMAFYRDVLCKATGQAEMPVHLIAVEKKAPYRCGVFLLPEESTCHVAGLQDESANNYAAIEELLDCIRTGLWPTRYESIRQL